MSTRRESGRGEEKRARGAAGRRRAQMYLGQLRWLEGFEADGRWWVVGGEPSGRTIDGLVVARARRTINTLRRDHGGALQDLLGDPAAWFAAADGMLRHLGERAHGRATSVTELAAPLPPRVRASARALEAEHPALGPLLHAATSAWLPRPDLLAAAIRWMRPRAPELKRVIDGAGPLGLWRALGLALRAIDEPAGVDALISLALADAPDAYQTSAQLANLIRRVFGGDKAPAPEPARSPATVTPWVDRLLSGEPAAARRALALLDAVDLAAAIRPWRDWEKAHEARFARAREVADREPFTGGPKLEDRQRLIAGLEVARAALPRVVNLVRILPAIDTLAAPEHQPFHRSTLRLLAASPHTDELIGARFLVHAAEAATYGDNEKAAWLWEAVAAELDAGAPARILAPWQKVFDGRSQGWLENLTLRPLRRPTDVRRFSAALAHLGREAPFTADQARALAVALAAGLDVAKAAALIRRLDLAGAEPSERLVRAGVALVGDEAGVLAGPVRALHAARTELGIDTEAPLAALCEHAAATGGAWLIAALLARDTRRIAELAEIAGFVPRRQWPPLCNPAAATDWIAKFPARLAPSLARLAATDPDAAATARRRTAVDLPDRAALVRETDALRARAPLGPREARRLANLEARIAAPRPPTATRLERLAAKIDAAALDSGITRFAAALTTAAETYLAAQLGVVEPGWTADRARRSILLGLIHLDPQDRALARRLLEARRGPPPWDLRDDPSNRAFLARLRARGVELAPWLDDNPHVVAGGDGQPVELAFSHDPLEVFAMGAHFSTCLAPGGANFFSVITNAADVNKRVLYARREGKVVGRCLLALTDAGEVLTFHPYAHDEKLDFEALVRRLVVDLAERMGTRVASTGRVKTLLGRDWYDDGVRDLVGRYGPLETADFAQALHSVPLAGAVALIVKTLGHGLDDATLPIVVATPAITQRPELIVPLAPFLLAHPTLSDHTLSMAAELATRVGQSDLADRLLLGPASRADLRYATWYWGQVLARRRPSFALTRLRQTRRPGVRGWDGEFGARLAVAGLAMEHLHRPRQAAEMYRRAIADDPSLKNDIGERLAALDGAHGR